MQWKWKLYHNTIANGASKMTIQFNAMTDEQQMQKKYISRKIISF